MAGMRLIGNSNMELLLQNGSSFVQSLEELVAAGSYSGFLHGHNNAITQPFYQTMEFAGETCNIDFDDGLQQPEKKRRLTEDQLQLLEKSFESENKLEPERKFQLAKELGLQPRQVAIWFQNRRARWKTKHLEKEYDTLRSSYDTLKVDYDNLLKERDGLQTKVLSLTNMLLEKEKGNNQKELTEMDIFSDKLQKLDSADTEVKKFDKDIVVCKEEDLSSVNSTELNSETPTFTDRGYSMLLETTSSSNAHESEISHVCEVEFKVCEFVAPDNILSTYDLQDGDQALWIWPSL